jgi:uncharacterized protein
LPAPGHGGFSIDGQLRTYRNWVKGGDLVSFYAIVKETDLYIRAQSYLKDEALAAVKKCRADIESYIVRQPEFLTTLVPIDLLPGVPPIVVAMADAARKAGVGPMAAVAGAVAEYVGRALMQQSPEVIVENGGDIFIATAKPRTIGVFAGDSPFSGKLAVEIGAGTIGACTSSGTVGHSLNFGNADAVLILSPSTALADAAATAVSNAVKTADDIPAAIELAQSIEGVTGVLIVIGDKLGVWGDVKLSSGGVA